MSLPYPGDACIDDPACPTWHLGPPAQWMNDPNGIIHHEGWWHAYYQHNPGGDIWGDMHWGHARSRDLIHWEHLPIALRPQLADGELHCYSGCCVLNSEGEPRILYTSVPQDGSRIFKQVLATPDDKDCLSWTQHASKPVLDLDTHDGPNFTGVWRDPYVFHADGRTFMILGAAFGDEAVLPLYENLDGQLRDWTYREILLRKPLSETKFFECPSIIQVDGHWVIFYAPYRQMEWYLGTLDLENYRFQIKESGLLGESKNCYASQPKTGPDGRPLVFNWIRSFPKNKGWNGRFGVIRRLWIGEDSRLCSAPIEELSLLQKKKISYPATKLTPDSHSLTMPGESSSHGEINLTLSDDAMLQIDLCGVTIVIDHTGVQFDDSAPSPLPSSSTIHFRWLLDRSLLELFINDRATYTRVVDYPTANTVAVKANQGTIQLADAHAWSLRASPSKPWSPPT